MILYLHGFRSSPQSFKASMIAERMQFLGRHKEYQCPQLPSSPRAAIDLSMRLASQTSSGNLTIIGSSLGGYYATWIAEQIGCRAVLLNPAINPAQDLKSHVGVLTAYHSDTRFEFKSEYLEELRAFAVTDITRPERYFLVAATGDEVIDWREMVGHYPLATHRIIKGSDHGISDFGCYLDEVLTFCEVDPKTGK